MVIENRILIEAPVETVWGATEDVQRWPEWTPTIEELAPVDGEPFQVGFKARIKQPGLPPTIWEVTALEPGKSFSWEAKVRGIRMVATHRLIPVDDGTENVLTIEATGLLAILLGPLIRSALNHALQNENQGLKAFCETMEVMTEA